MKRVFLAAPLLCAAVYGQPAGPTRPTFEVADIQLSKASAADPVQGRFALGRVDARNVTVKRMAIEAYSVSPDYVIGGPDWLDSDRFDIVAKAPPDTTDAILRVMLQNLLADRFHLVIHREDKVKPVYALVVGKGGPKIQPSKPGVKQSCTGGAGDERRTRATCQGISMTALALQLPRMAPRYVDVPVVDLTELQGPYDLVLEWSPRSDTEMPSVTMFDAVAKLGLKLESRKLPMSMVVVDSCLRTPTEQ